MQAVYASLYAQASSDLRVSDSSQEPSSSVSIMSGSIPQFKAPPAHAKPPGSASGATGHPVSHGVEYGRYVPAGTPVGYIQPQTPSFMPPGIPPPPPMFRPPQHGHPSMPPQYGHPSLPPQHGNPSSLFNMEGQVDLSMMGDNAPMKVTVSTFLVNSCQTSSVLTADLSVSFLTRKARARS